ncbi:hypothetical protein YC2023_108309 [Brassica napus]
MDIFLDHVCLRVLVLDALLVEVAQVFRSSTVLGPMIVTPASVAYRLVGRVRWFGYATPSAAVAASTPAVIGTTTTVIVVSFPAS